MVIIQSDVKRRMRTIKQLAEHYQSNDPDTAITVHFIRQLVLSGCLPCVYAGVKRLIAIEDMDEFLASFAKFITKESQYG